MDIWVACSQFRLAHLLPSLPPLRSFRYPKELAESSPSSSSWSKSSILLFCAVPFSFRFHSVFSGLVASHSSVVVTLSVTRSLAHLQVPRKANQRPWLPFCGRDAEPSEEGAKGLVVARVFSSVRSRLAHLGRADSIIIHSKGL